MVLDENLFEAKNNNFEKISDMIYQALTRLGYLVNADKVGYAITKRINPAKKLVSRQDKDFDFVTDEQLNDAKALLTKANIGYFVKRLLNQPTLYIDLTNFDEDDVNIEALERSIEDRFKGWLRKLYTKKYKDKSDDEIIKAFLTFVKYDANDDEIAELEDILDEFKSDKEKMLTESVADLTSIKIPGYTDTWSAIDVFTAPGPDFTRYFLMENDKYGDETQYLVVSEDLSEVYETYDDIETALRDEGILENLDESIVKTSKGKWTNKGKEGAHGEFTTKKKAREQQKAMFASGWKGESLEESVDRISIESDFEDITNMSDAKERLKKYDIDLIKKDNRNYILRKDGKEYTFYVLSNPNEVRKDLAKAVYKLTSGNSAIKDNSIIESKGVIRKYKGYTLHDTGDSITITDPHGKTVGTERTEIGAEGLIDDLVVGKDIKENIGSDIAEYQKWVDYDMKKYGRISNDTNEKIKKAGLEIVKDKYGDYEVIADEPIREDLEREFTIHYNREGFEFGGYGAVRVKATDEDEAKEKFYAEKKDDKITISSIRPTENEDIRKGIRLLEDKGFDEIEEIGESKFGTKEYKYKKYTIEHFPIDAHMDGMEPQHIESYIIKSPVVLTNSGYHLPLYCEDEKGNEVNFRSLQQVKDWIDKFDGKFKLQWKHGDELHAVIKDEFLEESLKNNEVADFFDKAKKLGVKTLKDLKILLSQPEAKGNSEKEKLDTYSKEANPEDKDLTEDVEVVDKNQTEIDKKVGLENLVNDLINDENEAINGYNSAIVTFELEGKSDLTDVFRDIIKDEQNHIGNLQKVLNEINPTTIANLEQGQQEAADTLNK